MRFLVAPRSQLRAEMYQEEIERGDSHVGSGGAQDQPLALTYTQAAAYPGAKVKGSAARPIHPGEDAERRPPASLSSST